MSRGWWIFWIIVIVIIAPGVITSLLTALGPALTTFAHNLQQIFANAHH
jgi:hypothetical protein